jgi:hypothetical protein
MLDLEPKQAEEKEEIVCRKILKGGRDVFFCDQYSCLAKARSKDAAESLEGGGDGTWVTQLRDPDTGLTFPHIF